jgi:hypothetical protein
MSFRRRGGRTPGPRDGIPYRLKRNPTLPVHEYSSYCSNRSRPALKRDVRLITEIHELRVELKSIVDTESAKVKLKFRIALNFEAGIDGASETDGVDLVTTALPGFPRGVLIVQDGRNIAPPEPQNFKLINWAQVEALLAR